MPLPVGAVPRIALLVLALLLFGVAAFAAVSRRAVLAVASLAVGLGLAFVWEGDEFGFLNV